MIKEILIFEAMCGEETGMEAVGVWESDKERIIIKHDRLEKMALYTGTLLHETGYVLSGAGDVSREFEQELTDIIGKISSRSTS